MSTVADYPHVHSAHCESGAVAGLVTHAGLPLSEAMAFGLSATLCFAFLPFVKMGGCPLTSYRMPPGGVIKGLGKRLGLPLRFRKYKDEVAAMDDLDRALDAGRVVGCQTSVFWLPYFPEHMRFHFNAHNVVIFGREGDEYLISDPVFEDVVRCHRDDVRKARFATGVFAPKGGTFTLDGAPGDLDLEAAVRGAVRLCARRMLQRVMPIVGVKGMERVARYVRALPGKHRDKPRRARLILGSIVRMQEEIGTGGAGVRFLQASFLQEAGQALDDDTLRQASEQMTAAGDELRQFALLAVRAIKGEHDSFDEPAEQFVRAAHVEREAHRLLKRW